MTTNLTPEEFERENLVAAVYTLDLPEQNLDEIFSATLPVLLEVAERR